MYGSCIWKGYLLPIIVQKEWYTEKQIKENPDIYFVFGDNIERVGTGGQAKFCRNKKNCIGIVTKAKPTYDSDAFLSDDQLTYNCALISRDFWKVIFLLKKGHTIVFPADGIGTGRADLANKAPLTNMYVQTMWKLCLDMSKELEAQKQEKELINETK